jgi:hypothetical protein
MLNRTTVLTAFIASCVSSAVTLSAALLVLAPGIRAAPDPQAVQPVVRAERFEVVDQTGNVLARLGQQVPGTPVGALWTSRTSLEFLDQAGQVRAVMGMSLEDAPAVFVSDDQGTTLSLVQPVRPDGTSAGVALSMGTRTPQGRALRLVEGVSPDSGPYLLLFDATSQPRAELGVLADGSAVVRMRDGNDQVIWEAP